VCSSDLLLLEKGFREVVGKSYDRKKNFFNFPMRIENDENSKLKLRESAAAIAPQTGILAAKSYYGSLLADELDKRGLRVGEEVNLVGINSSDFPEHDEPTFPTLNFSDSAQTRRALEIIIDDPKGEVREWLRPVWKER